jgi:hypothetical protein
MVSSGGEQRLWRLESNSGNWIDQGRLKSSGFSWFVQSGRILLTLTSGEITIQPLDIDDLIVRVPEFVGRNLSPAEWTNLFPQSEYQESFSTIPPNPERIHDLCNRGEVLARSGKREEAAQLFSLAAQLAVRTGSAEINKDVASSAQKIGLGFSASAAAKYLAQILPKDQEIQELLGSSVHPEPRRLPLGPR